MSQDYHYTVGERFLKYVTIDTQSDPFSVSFPSTEKQKDLSRILVKELQDLGLNDAHLDDYGYVYATLPSNTDQNVPVICFCSHVDTSPDCSGAGVKPIVHANYDRGDIQLPDDPAQVISPQQHPYLKEKTGDDIITASGKTLLGADDKAGVAIIMDLAHYLQTHHEVKHGTIRILFTPDEEVGRGVDHVDLKKLGADFAYTLDGGPLGSYTDETFSADGVQVDFHGVSIHPGYAKGQLVNALKVASHFMELLPGDRLSPETTSDREGFVHPVSMDGGAEKATVRFIVRDFDTPKLALYAQQLEALAQQAIADYPGARYEFAVSEQYRNMKEVVSRFPQIETHVRTAMERSGVLFKKSSARGGTDGSRLSFMGLPCPDIFTGEMAFHGKQEYVSLQDMQRSVDVLIQLVQAWAEGEAG
ncbi:peptidase T [Niabella terrae]